ncbi:MAG TPA: hypothetical protein VGR35_16450 [Tepidisphaeraceae bacterium]|nr:hypothetical protein [Tepidisphaeraceae bacterium]
MSRRCCWLCPLPLIALALLVVSGSVRGQSAAPFREDTAPFGADAASTLIDVRDEDRSSTISLHADAAKRPTWTFVWSDLGVSNDASPTAGAAGGGEHFARIHAPPSKAPPIIAAPLPPALFSGLIGLAGVYVYKRLRMRG